MVKRTPPASAMAPGGDTGAASWWTDQLPVCKQSGVGYSINMVYDRHGQPTNRHVYEDFSIRVRMHDTMLSLYAVFDGYDGGKRFAEFAVQRMCAELLLDHAAGAAGDDALRQSLRRAFHAVENGCMEHMAEALARRSELLDEANALSDQQWALRFPSKAAELAQIEERVRGGATCVVALLCGDRLFVANTGDCRALLCRSSSAEQLHVTQLCPSHDCGNADERRRLGQLGVPQPVLDEWGPPYSTRCLGDYRRKAGYKEVPALAFASDEPVTALPDICGPFTVDRSYRFLVLLTAGVAATWLAATGSGKPNADIAGMVASEFQLQNSHGAVAQAVVDRINRVHCASYQRGSEECAERDDLTILVRGFDQPLGVYAPTMVTGAQQLAQRAAAAADDESAGRPPCAVDATPVGDGETTLASGNNMGLAQSVPMTDCWLSNGPPPMELDDDGRVQPYVDFAPYYELTGERPAGAAPDAPAATDNDQMHE